MPAIYILSDFGKLQKENETLVFLQPDGTKTILFPYKTEQLILMGAISITGEAFRLITRFKIPVTFISSNGKFNARLAYEDSKNVLLRQKQYRMLDDSKQSLEMARSIVAGKIRNQLSFVQRIKRKDGIGHTDIEDAADAMKQSLQSAEEADTVDKLRGIEGNAARTYFKVFRYNIKPEWAEFTGRSRQPPQSNVNAVLGFLYTILMYHIDAALGSQGLDTMAGNLHAVNYGKSALVFDLMEEFRAPVADSLCCALFNLEILQPEDFEKKTFSETDNDYPVDETAGEGDEKSGILLTPAGLKKVIKAFEEKTETEVLYAPTGEKLSYRKIFVEQAKQYRRVVSGEEKAYRSFYFK